MKKFSIIFLSSILFFGGFQEIFANQCLNSNIAAYFLDNKNTYDKTENEDFNKKNKDLVIFISNQRQVFLNNISGQKGYELENIKTINQNFIDIQNEKFSLAIKFSIKKFLESDKNYNGEKISLKYLDNFKKDGKSEDFFIEKYLDENKNIQNIPTSILQKSIYLDFLIFSCLLGEYGEGSEFVPGGSIVDLMSKSDSKEFEKKEILEKQKIVVQRSIFRYQSFLINRQIYTSLRGVIEKLEHLKWRFEDFTRLIGFLPAKLVDFGYKGN